MKSTFFFFLFTCLFACVYSQPGIIWNTSVPGVLAPQVDPPPKIHFDSDGNILTLQHARDFDNQDIWLVKLDSDGNIFWSATYDSPFGLTDRAQHIYVDRSGNIYIHGFTQTKIILDGGLVDWEIAPLTLKYSPGGQLLWEHIMEVENYNSDSNPTSVIADSIGNCYVTGGKWDSIHATFNMYLTKYDTTGWVEWEIFESNDIFSTCGLQLAYLGDSIRVRRRANSNDLDERYLSTLIYDLDGNQLKDYTEPIVNWYSTVKKAEDNQGNFYWMSGRSIFKYDQFSGSQWQYDEIPTGTNSLIFDFVVDEEENVYLTGSNEGMFTAKLDANGNELWKTWNAFSTAGRHLDVDADGNVTAGCYKYENLLFYMNLVQYSSDGAQTGSIVYANANIDDIRIYDDASFITTIRDYNETDIVTVQRYDLVLPIVDPGPVPAQELIIFPNPATDQLSFRFPGKTFRKGSLMIKDICSRLVYQKDMEALPDNQIDVSHLIPGIYFLEILTDEKRYVGKFVVEE
ncbi:MAG: T9SS type A sorting domain-containing protein [Bacteroidota bacterium]